MNLYRYWEKPDEDGYVVADDIAGACSFLRMAYDIEPLKIKFVHSMVLIQE